MQTYLRGLATACLAIRLSVHVIAANPPLDPKAAGPLRTVESFSENPLQHGWEATGETNLFHWNQAQENLEVTWDSRNPNSYFRYPFESEFTSEEDFSVSLDLLLHDVGAARPEYPGALEVAFGFQHRAEADRPDFIRGTGTNSPNLVELNYFPDTGFGATVWPAMVPTNGVVNYSGAGDFGIFELPLNVPMKVLLAYTASNHTVTLTVRTNGTVVGEVVDAPLVDVEGGFRLDAFTIASYSDAGQDPSYPGSVLAHGEIDNIEIITPPRPIGLTTGGFDSGEWIQQFYTVRGWKYQLESSDDLRAWIPAGDPIDGNGGLESMRASGQAAAAHRFFRVRAFR